LESGTEEELLKPSPSGNSLLTRPFKTPISEMGRLAWDAYRLKWAFGYRLIGPNAWTRKVRKRFSYERWVRSHVSGWPGFMLWRLGIRVPFSAVLSGKEFTVGNETQRVEFSRQVRKTFQPFPFEETPTGDHTGVFRLKFGGKDLAFDYGRDRFGTSIVLTECFIDEYFAGLDVAGADVVDVGSCMGETPVYFSVKGAHRVIAFEPYPATYTRAKLNVSLNDLDDRVILLNEGGGASGWMKLARTDMNLWANAVPSTDGEEIRFNSLRDIIARFGIVKGVLKYHGEGSEYEFFENASSEDLAHFPQIAMKYHYGGKQIVKKLESAGFTIVRKWDLHFSFNASSSSPRYQAGLILARLKGTLQN
jgi:FkbM family methyltransferase